MEQLIKGLGKNLSLNPKYILDLDAGGHAPTYRERKPKAWTPMYHSGYLQAFRTALSTAQTIDLIRNLNLTVPWLTVYKDFEYTFTVNVPEGTVLESATAWAKITPLDGYSYLRAWLNGVEWDGAAKIGVLPHPGLEKGTAYTISDGVMALIKPTPPDTGQATNQLAVRIFNYNFWSTLTAKVSIWLDLTYSGAKPPTVVLPIWETWPDWWPYAAAGVGMGVLGGAILIRGKKR